MSRPVTDLTPSKHDWRWVFLKVLAQSCCVSEACVAAGISRVTAYKHRERFPKFRKKWDEAIEISVEALEVFARRRAFNLNDPSSHILTMFLLKAHKPHKYRDNGHQIPKDDPEDLSARLTPEALASLSPEELNALESIAAKLALQANDSPSANPG